MPTLTKIRKMEDNQGGNDLRNVEVDFHPLMIEHVAKKVFSFFPPKYSSPELLSCRLVCQCWSEIITNKVKRAGNAPKITFSQGDTQRFNEFMEMEAQTVNLPFEVFTFDLNFFVRRHTSPFKDFLRICSPFISELVVVIGKDYNLDFPSIGVTSAVDFSNLKSLSIQFSHLITMQSETSPGETCFYRDPKYQLEGIKVLIDLIMKSATSLKSLKIDLPSNYLEGDCQESGNKEIGELVGKYVTESVTDLELSMKLDSEHLKCLEKLKLKQLNLRFYGKHEKFSVESLKTFLKKQSKSLVSLKIVDLESLSVDWSEEYFPARFEKLQELEIKSSEVYSLNPDGLGQLKTVTLFSPLSQNATAGETVRPLGSVTELNLNFVVGRQTISLLQVIPAYFPNITKSSVVASEESEGALIKLFEILVELKELKVTFQNEFNKYSIDPFLTGLPFKVCHLVGGHHLYREEEITACLRHLPRPRSFNVENLRHLESLVINVSIQEIRLTDVAVYYAILRCVNLRRLRLEGFHEISKPCLALLETRFTLENEAKSNNQFWFEHDLDQFANHPIPIYMEDDVDDSDED